MLGLKSPEDVIGKTDYDLLWKSAANTLRETDQRIMQTKVPEEVIETPTIANGKTIVMLTKKSPL
ncbi:MAG: PAS domain-containing protein [Endomicrobium sp.]|nr:PAS domain-containing protein [Endomicrobium sp.]